ncbi:MAG: exo-alpha-sialidase [Chitinophagaceae bacterium]|nr:MAG: exo-alpha-sialidase [Chitinophagaceae bacterium]
MNKILSRFYVYLFLTVTAIALIVMAGCGDAANNGTAIHAGTISPLPSPATDSCGEPYLFTDKKGLVHLSWIEKKGKTYQLRFSTFKDQQWTTSISIAEGENWFVNWADYPVISGDGESHLFAHFLEKSDSGAYTYDVKYVTSADRGTTWTSPKLLHNDGKKAEHGFVSVIPYGDKYFVSWLDGRNTGDASSSAHEAHHGQMSLRAALISMNGNKEKEWELDDKVCDCCQTTITTCAEGPVVIYRDRTDAEIRDLGLVRMVSGEWSKPGIVSADNWKIEGCPVNGPRTEAIGTDLGVAWFTVKNDTGEVKLAFSGNGGKSFGIPIKVSESNANGRVDMVLLDKATAIVSWMEGSVIKAAKIHKDGTKDASVVVAESSEARSAGFPQMTKSGSGLMFAWTDNKSKSIKIASMELR